MSRVWEPTPKGRAFSLRPFGGDVVSLESNDLDFFRDAYEIDARGTIRLAPVTQRYVLPVYSPEYHVRGMVLRVPWAGAPRQACCGFKCLSTCPKADTYMSRDEPVQSFYDGGGTALVAVEDQLSAIKVAQYGLDSIALLGTPWSRDPKGYQGADRVMEIARAANGREVIVALDADATDAAFEFVKKWRYAFRRIRVAMLEKDLKDTKMQDFAEVLGVTV